MLVRRSSAGAAVRHNGRDSAAGADAERELHESGARAASGERSRLRLPPEHSCVQRRARRRHLLGATCAARTQYEYSITNTVLVVMQCSDRSIDRSIRAFTQVFAFAIRAERSGVYCTVNTELPFYYVMCAVIRSYAYAYVYSYRRTGQREPCGEQRPLDGREHRARLDQPEDVLGGQRDRRDRGGQLRRHDARAAYLHEHVEPAIALRRPVLRVLLS